MCVDAFDGTVHRLAQGPLNRIGWEVRDRGCAEPTSPFGDCDAPSLALRTNRYAYHRRVSPKPCEMIHHGGKTKTRPNDSDERSVEVKIH